MENKKLNYDSECNYHDDDVRLNNYSESADIPKLERTDVAQADFNSHIKPDIDPILLETVVKQIQAEIGRDIILNPAMGVHEIKLQATRRFLDLVEKGLLTEREANRCYQRFAHLVDWYYGAN